MTFSLSLSLPLYSIFETHFLAHDFCVALFGFRLFMHFHLLLTSMNDMDVLVLLAAFIVYIIHLRLISFPWILFCFRHGETAENIWGKLRGWYLLCEKRPCGRLFHSVLESALSLSSTRYSPWNVVRIFLPISYTLLFVTDTLSCAFCCHIG